jgi:formate-dependent nitrite reductase membrane component NrfD
MVLALISLGGGDFGRSWQIGASLAALIFMALTGVFLVADLTHPRRFYYVLIRPQWRSWLARGAYLIGAYTLIVVLFLIAALLREQGVVDALRWPAVVLAVPCAVYTACILQQSKGRDLWQNPLLPAVFLIEASLAGAAALLLIALGPSLPEGTFDAVALTLTVSALLMAAAIFSESVFRHESPYAASAASVLIRGAYGRLYWSSLILVVAAAPLGIVAYAASSIGFGALGAIVALAGLFAYEHAYIQAGQVVPQA